MERILSEEEVREFEHLWDGSEQWGLIAHYWTKATLTVVFSGASPSVAEIIALRRLREEFRALPVSELKAFLANKRELQLSRYGSFEDNERKAPPESQNEGHPQYFSSMEAHEIVDRAAQLEVPFAIRTEGKSGISYTAIQYVDGQEMVLLIDEDDELDEAVMCEMVKRGVPIVSHTEE